jgi:chemotaxis protein CheY-P-specific phosphatase CheC
MSGSGTTIEKLEARKENLKTDLAYLDMKFELLPCSQKDEEHYVMLMNELESTQLEIDYLLWEALLNSGG